MFTVLGLKQHSRIKPTETLIKEKIVSQMEAT